ncbi:MAG: hypothetical protein ACO3QC_02440 [Phycisphaerales bacterium]
MFIAKKSLTFKNTIVNLDDLIARWNSRSLREVLREDDAIEALVQELERRKLIRSSDSPDPSPASSPFAASTRALPEPPTRSSEAKSTPAERPPPRSPSVPPSPSGSSASASLLQPGSSVTTRNAEFKLASVRIDQRVRPTEPAAPTGKIFVIAIWSLTNRSNEPIPTTGYLGMVSELIDGKGRKFAADAMQSGMYGLGRDGWRDLLGPINPGDAIDQAAVFLVPTDAISGAHIRTGTLRFPGEREIRIAIPER